MVEWPGAEPVTRVERRAVVKQFGRQSDTIATTADLRFGSFKPAVSSSQRWDSAARAAEASLNRAITIEHRNRICRYKALSPWQTCFIAAMRLAQRQASAKKEKSLEE
jgi:hypothetical protein